MTTRTLPTIIATRSVFGIIPSTTRRNVAWNADGQCLILTRQGVTVATPYLATALPLPEAPLDASMQGGGAGANGVKEEDIEDDMDMDVDAPSSSTVKLGRPRTGEIKWWITPIGMDKGKNREDEFEWAETGDEFSGLIIDKDKERNIRAAVWSPPGIGGGGALMAVMASTAQVSVFAPGQDPYSNEYVEIADITSMTMDLLPDSEKPDEIPTMAGMLRMRCTAMEWSLPLPLPTMVGVDGSVLALANRAGGIDFWSANTDRSFERIAQVSLSKPWAVELTWTAWVAVDEHTCSAELAIATTDGSVWILDVKRVAVPLEARWECQVGDLRLVAPADKRQVTALQWITGDRLVWAKAGSVHFWTAGTTPSMVRLERVGNWAGCNALNPCVGLHLRGTTVTVVLASLTYHLIEDVFSAPKLGSKIDSLRLTLSARDVFLDCAKRRRRGFVAMTDREFTAHTAGWAPLDASGDIVSWMAEPITFHNLDSATEVNRIGDFVVADLHSTIVPDEAVVAAISATLAHPPSLLHNSPLGVLLPHLTRALVADETLARLLYTLVEAPHEAALPVVPDIADKERALLSMLWGAGCPDSLRLHYVFAQWGARAYPLLSLEFGGAAEAYLGVVQRTLAAIALAWASSAHGETVGPLDAQYLGHLLAISGPDVQVDTSLRALASETGAATACPACGSPVEFGSGSSTYCSQGHEWERCSITHLLITSPEYRLCTVCPAVALRPEASGEDNHLVHAALAAAVDCQTCGGRWARPV